MHHKVKYVNLTDVCKAIGYSDLLQDNEDLMHYLDWASWGTNAITLVGNSAVLDSLLEYFDSRNDQTFTDNQRTVLIQKFWGFVGIKEYINLEA